MSSFFPVRLYLDTADARPVQEILIASIARTLQGYLVTQIPGSWAIQRSGAKLVMSVDMAITAALCLLIPSVITNGGPRMLAPVLTMIGLSQGPLIPSLQVLKKDWLPSGPARAMILRMM